jgi:hypothetical protein
MELALSFKWQKNFPDQMSKKCSHLQMDIFCHFNFCHNKRNVFRFLPTLSDSLKNSLCLRWSNWISISASWFLEFHEWMNEVQKYISLHNKRNYAICSNYTIFGNTLFMYMLWSVYEISAYLNGLPPFQSVYIMANLNKSLHIRTRLN